MVEHRSDMPKVVGSIPTQSTFYQNSTIFRTEAREKWQRIKQLYMTSETLRICQLTLIKQLLQKEKLVVNLIKNTGNKFKDFFKLDDNELQNLLTFFFIKNILFLLIQKNSGQSFKNYIFLISKFQITFFSSYTYLLSPFFAIEPYKKIFEIQKTFLKTKKNKNLGFLSRNGYEQGISAMIGQNEVQVATERQLKVVIADRKL